MRILLTTPFARDKICHTWNFSGPPSSSGLGRGPLKAKTGIRIPLGAPNDYDRQIGGRFFISASTPGTALLRAGR